MGELLPSVNLEAQYQQRYDLSQVLDGEEATTVVGRVTVPLYQGGGVSARVRQAKQTNTEFKRLVESARLSAHSDVLANWGILQTSGPEITAARSAVASNKISLVGTRKEQSVGRRTTLDVLNAQRELVDSQIGSGQVAARPPRRGIFAGRRRRPAGRTEPRAVDTLLRSNRAL